MSERFEFERFDLRGCACDECDAGVTPRAEFDGEWVKAKAAIDREAENAAKILRMSSTLAALWREVMGAEPLAQVESAESFTVTLIERVRELAADKARLDSGCIMTRDYDEFGGDEVGDGYINCERRGLDLRAAIDAAMKEQEKRT